MSLRILCLAMALVVPALAQNDAAAREQALLDRIEQLEKRVAELEKHSSPPDQARASAAVAAPDPPPAAPAAVPSTTVNFQVDGYYGYNFNAPIGRVNLLRAYDVLSNSFSLNQASVIVENAPDPAKGKRFGARLDLQFGQATQTLQGSSANELRPEIYRAIFQAYGTYIFPLGRGLTVDFGKWASSLGIEGNYSKDQVNYSRSFWYNYLPFYHMGVRASYPLNDNLAVNYWVTNGANQAETFKGFKDQLFGFTLRPAKPVLWTANYYLGEEHPDVIVYPNGAPAGSAALPTLQGIPFSPIAHPAAGRLHIFDSYATLQASPKLSFALEGDYVNERLYGNSPPGYTYGGAGYAKYQVTPRFALGGRFEYLADRGGLFTGVPQVLREATVTTDYKFGEGFLTRLEYRRDFSNLPYFYSDTPGLLKKEQSTATVGLVWWFGSKQGAW